MLIASPAAYAEGEAPRWQYGLSFSYLTGDYGQDDDTDIVYTAATVKRYLDKGDVTLTVPYVDSHVLHCQSPCYRKNDLNCPHKALPGFTTRQHCCCRTPRATHRRNGGCTARTIQPFRETVSPRRRFSIRSCHIIPIAKVGDCDDSGPVLRITSRQDSKTVRLQRICRTSQRDFPPRIEYEPLPATRTTNPRRTAGVLTGEAPGL